MKNELLTEQKTLGQHNHISEADLFWSLQNELPIVIAHILQFVPPVELVTLDNLCVDHGRVRHHYAVLL